MGKEVTEVKVKSSTQMSVRLDTLASKGHELKHNNLKITFFSNKVI